MNESEPAASEPKASPSAGCVCGGKGPMLSQLLQTMMPSAAAGEHFRNARLEFLKGFRELLDHRIQTLSEKHQRGTKVSVE